MSKCKKEICVEINFEDLDFDEMVEFIESQGYEVLDEDDIPESIEDLDDEDLISELQDRDYFVYENPCKDGELCFESLNEDWREMLTSKLGVPFMTDTEEIINLIRCKLL